MGLSLSVSTIAIQVVSACSAVSHNGICDKLAQHNEDISSITRSKWNNIHLEYSKLLETFDSIDDEYHHKMVQINEAHDRDNARRNIRRHVHKYLAVEYRGLIIQAKQKYWRQIDEIKEKHNQEMQHKHKNLDSLQDLRKAVDTNDNPWCHAQKDFVSKAEQRSTELIDYIDDIEQKYINRVNRMATDLEATLESKFDEYEQKYGVIVRIYDDQIKPLEMKCEEEIRGIVRRKNREIEAFNMKEDHMEEINKEMTHTEIVERILSDEQAKITRIAETRNNIKRIEKRHEEKIKGIMRQCDMEIQENMRLYKDDIDAIKTTHRANVDKMSRDKLQQDIERVLQHRKRNCLNAFQGY